MKKIFLCFCFTYLFVMLTHCEKIVVVIHALLFAYYKTSKFSELTDLKQRNILAFPITRGFKFPPVALHDTNNDGISFVNFHILTFTTSHNLTFSGHFSKKVQKQFHTKLAIIFLKLSIVLTSTSFDSQHKIFSEIVCLFLKDPTRPFEAINQSTSGFYKSLILLSIGPKKSVHSPHSLDPHESCLLYFTTISFMDFKAPKKIFITFYIAVDTQIFTCR